LITKRLYEKKLSLLFSRVGNALHVIVLRFHEKGLSGSQALQIKKWNLHLVVNPNIHNL